MHAAFRIDVGGVLFRVRGAGQDDVGTVRAGVAVVSLIDDEGFAQPSGVDLVGAQKIDNFDPAFLGALEDVFGIAAVLARHEPQVQPADPGRRRVQDVEAVPAPLGVDQAVAFGDLAGQSQNYRPVAPGQGALAKDQHRPFRLLQDLGEIMAAAGDPFQDFDAIAQMVVFVGQIVPRPNDADGEISLDPALSDPGVQNRGLAPGIGADQQARIGVFDAGDGGIEQVAHAAGRVQPGAVLAAIGMGRAQHRHQVLQRHHRFTVREIAGDGGDAVALDALEAFANGGEGLGPGDRLEPAVPAHVRPVQTLEHQPITGEAGLVRNPFLVHVFIQTRQDPHDLGPTGIDADGRTDGVQRVDGLRLHQFP